MSDDTITYLLGLLIALFLGAALGSAIALRGIGKMRKELKESARRQLYWNEIFSTERASDDYPKGKLRYPGKRKVVN